MVKQSELLFSSVYCGFAVVSGVKVSCGKILPRPPVVGPLGVPSDLGGVSWNASKNSGGPTEHRRDRKERRGRRQWETSQRQRVLGAAGGGDCARAGIPDGETRLTLAPTDRDSPPMNPNQDQVSRRNSAAPKTFSSSPASALRRAAAPPRARAARHGLALCSLLLLTATLTAQDRKAADAVPGRERKPEIGRAHV